MSNQQLIALKSFLNKGVMVRKGDTFSVDHRLAVEYTARGLAEEHGHAKTAKKVEEAETVSYEPVREHSTDGLSSLRIVELRELAKKAGVKNVQALTKKQLIDGISGKGNK